MLFFLNMKYLAKNSKHTEKAQPPIIITIQNNQVVAKLEATLTRKENQKVKEKAHNTWFLVSRSFKACIPIYVFWKSPINKKEIDFFMLLPKPVRPVDSEKKGKED